MKNIFYEGDIVKFCGEEWSAYLLGQTGFVTRAYEGQFEQPCLDIMVNGQITVGITGWYAHELQLVQSSLT